jgi:carboxymethylenebutenolidase
MMIQLTAGDGSTFSAYRADPAQPAKGAVVVLQDIFGITADVRKAADGFAAAGYRAIVPSLFDRVKPGAVLGTDAAGRAEAAEISAAVVRERALDDIQAAVDAVRDAGKVAVVGFCWGGDLAYAAANKLRGIACVVGYDGSDTVADHSEKRKVPTLLHFGTKAPDPLGEQITQFRAHRPDVSTFIYGDSARGFGTADRGSYRPDAAGQARERTLAWISQFVEGQPPVLLKNAGAYAQAKTEKKKKTTAGADSGPPME